MKRMQVAQFKRDLSQVLDAAERGEQVVVVRRGKPVALLSPVAKGEGRARLPAPRRPGGLLALAGLLADWTSMEEDIAEVIAARQHVRDRPTTDLG
ncbi:MAG: type II toxin-antitoxin system prevent-host-death family antitoxin [Chloroflexi bacterium]|nr:type II toxin-antitoxin system prevent-host-death family antitoxin [Chloroflexota bacterium]